MTRELRISLLAWSAMLVLLAMTYGASFFVTGPAGVAVNLGIALAKAALVYWFFMQGRREEGIVRLSGLVGVAWLGILFLLTFSDYASR